MYRGDQIKESRPAAQQGRGCRVEAVLRVKMEAEILLPLPRKQAASPSASWAPCPFVLLLRANPRGSPKPSFLSPSLSPHIPAISSTCGPSPSPRQAGTSVLFLCLLTAPVIFLLGPHDSPYLRPPSHSRPLPVSPSPFPPAVIRPGHCQVYHPPGAPPHLQN